MELGKFFKSFCVHIINGCPSNYSLRSRRSPSPSVTRQRLQGRKKFLFPKMIGMDLDRCRIQGNHEFLNASIIVHICITVSVIPFAVSITTFTTVNIRTSIVNSFIISGHIVNIRIRLLFLASLLFLESVRSKNGCPSNYNLRLRRWLSKCG